jgi:hypothetical protein
MFTGFSCKAYTASAVAGNTAKGDERQSKSESKQPLPSQLCERVGLLSKGNHEQVPFDTSRFIFSLKV